MRTTEFRNIGVGIAISNVELKKGDLKVYLIEQGSLKSGEIMPGEASLPFDLDEYDGLKVRGELKTTHEKDCKWLPYDGNRMQAPSVRRGEWVEVFELADSGIYYWRSMGLDGHLRRLDTIIIAISDTTDESTTQLTPDNSYWIEFSTHSKKLAFQTAKSDGEAFMYSGVVDAKVGMAELKDDAGQSFLLRSKEELIQLQNGQESTFLMEKELMRMSTKAKASVELNKGNITAQNGKESKYTLLDDVITIESPLGGKIVIDDKVVAQSKAGSKMELSENANTESSDGNKLSLGQAAAKLEDAAGGKVEIAGGMVNSN